MDAPVGPPLKPVVELELEVALVGEQATRLEASFEEVLQPLDHALGLRIGRLAEAPREPQLAAERGEVVGRAALACVQGALPVPDERLGQRPERPQTGPIPQRMSGACFEKTKAPAPARE